MDPHSEVEVIVLGAGFAGLCAAIELKRSDRRDFVILEKASEVGGTWRENTYPGVECDVPSHLYSYSFQPHPGWSRWYAPGAEILDYLRTCADVFGLDEHIQFDAAARSAEWDGTRWVVTTEDGRTFAGRHLIAGLGGLHVPNVPDLPGAGDFPGPMFHTSQWRHDVDLAGKRVGMIGTGATAVQAAPEVAAVAADFHLFQRSAVWVGPKPDPGYDEAERARLDGDVDALRRLRWDLWRTWETAGLELFREGSATNRAVEESARQNILRSIDDPELIEKLTPTYNITCKRPTLSNTYYPMFNRPNVHLHTDPIKGIDESGIELVDGTSCPLDVIILATGFKAFNITNEIGIRGLDGLPLAQAWADRVAAYRTVMVPRFPNLYILTGPNSSGVTSAIQMIEAGARFARRMIEHCEQTEVDAVHPTQTATDEFLEFIDRLTKLSPANKGCQSWWTDPHTGTNHALFPESSVTYKMMLEDFRPEHYDVARTR